MTDRPYTDDDLRAEAAGQLYYSGGDITRRNVGETMEDNWVPSLSTDDDDSMVSWWELLDPGSGSGPYNEARDAIYKLIMHSADTARWAVDLGADGLEPTGNVINIGADTGTGDTPRVRLHFAFHPDMDDDARDGFVLNLSSKILRDLADPS